MVNIPISYCFKRYKKGTLARNGLSSYPEVFWKIYVLKRLTIFPKILDTESYSFKIVQCQPTASCYLSNFAKFLQKVLFQNTTGWLLLYSIYCWVATRLPSHPSSSTKWLYHMTALPFFGSTTNVAL